jgi:hypothetical protein
VFRCGTYRETVFLRSNAAGKRGNHSLVGSGGEDSGCALVGDRMEGFTNIAASFALDWLLVQCLFKIIALSRCFQTAAPFSEPFLAIY